MPFAALALAGIIATTVETILFNALTVGRTRIQAGRERAGPGFLHAVPIQLACLLLRRPFTLVVQAFLAADGHPAFVAGCWAGLLEGAIFTPTRRVATMQLALDRPPPVLRMAADIVRTEGWGGLWLGWPANALRTALGAGVYYGTVALAGRLLPGAGLLAYGALGSAVATLVLNPFDVMLVLLYTGHRPPASVSVLARGLGLSLARNVPGGALRWWLTQNLARFLSGLPD